MIFFSDEVHVDYSKVKNENCGEIHEIPVSTTELQVTTKNVEKITNNSTPSIKVALGTSGIS